MNELSTLTGTINSLDASNAAKEIDENLADTFSNLGEVSMRSATARQRTMDAHSLKSVSPEITDSSAGVAMFNTTLKIEDKLDTKHSHARQPGNIDGVSTADQRERLDTSLEVSNVGTAENTVEDFSETFSSLRQITSPTRTPVDFNRTRKTEPSATSTGSEEESTRYDGGSLTTVQNEPAIVKRKVRFAKLGSTEKSRSVFKQRALTLQEQAIEASIDGQSALGGVESASVADVDTVDEHLIGGAVRDPELALLEQQVMEPIRDPVVRRQPAKMAHEAAKEFRKQSRM